MPARLTYDLRDAIATITLDDGKANALSTDMLVEIGGALTRAEADRAAVLLQGRPGMFSAGFDLRVLKAGGPEVTAMFLGGFELAHRLLSFPSPVVVACTGHALAMGSFLLLSADYRVGTSGLYKIGANEVAIGLTMPFFGIEICRQRLTPAYFQRSVINAEIHSPEAAVLAGFLDRVVPEGELLATARTVAAELGKLDRDTHTATKRRARGQALAAIRAAIDADAELFRATG